MPEHTPSNPTDQDKIFLDAVLEPHIRPAATRSQAVPVATTALLTGACGFLGRYVVRALLQHTHLRLICLVRDQAEATALLRTQSVLRAIGVTPAQFDERIEVLSGDISAPQLGLDCMGYADLAARVDTIYHCAAKVDWVRSYAQLSRTNVGGVRAMIELACQGRRKRLLFVSSVAVCYANSGPAHVDEDTDMLPYMADMPLGYARSKCVAEALLRQAAERGVPVTVVRPALIAGDSVSGACHASDFIAALLQSCVTTGMALDTDWQLDCVPVDFVAQVIAQVPQGAQSFQVLHLMHRHPRAWRELVLWINLHGYPVCLQSAQRWMQHLFDEGYGQSTLLYSQRQFFRGKAAHNSQHTISARPKPYETYLAATQSRISAQRTRAVLTNLGLHEPALDVDLLHRYFAHYRHIGLLPARAKPSADIRLAAVLENHAWQLQGNNGVVRHLPQAQATRMGADNGLLSDMASARVRHSIGLWQLHWPQAQAGATWPQSVVLKAKTSDQLLQDLTTQLATVCQPELGIAFAQSPEALELAGSHTRELALYRQAHQDPRLQRYMPVCYGTLADDGQQRWALLMEYLPEARASEPLHADSAAMQTVLKGLAQIHSVGYGLSNQATLQAQYGLTPMLDTVQMCRMAPLWHALVDYAAPWFAAWCTPAVRQLQHQAINTLDNWWPRLCSLPTTLIHNDFNPRNLVVRPLHGSPTLCAYDWELAAWGLPQHDLAELLCFTWQGRMTALDLHEVVEAYRQLLSQATGQTIGGAPWREGFALSLKHLLIKRLALYTLIHRFRPQTYLPQVMQNWMHLYSASAHWATSCSEC